MKKSLLALAVLASAAGAAQAASSVTLYGRMDVGYNSYHHDALKTLQTNNGSRIGFKGQEDLGNGLAATFKLEGALAADTGAGFSGFQRESTVGLKGAFGHVRFGRAAASMDTAMGDWDYGRDIASFANYTSNTRVSNGMFYDFESNGFKAGGHVTTKNGYDNALVEGQAGGKMGWGVYAGYSANNINAAAAYQKDGAAKEWGVAAAYTFNPVTVGASYASHKLSGAKTRVIQAHIAADVTANDNVYFQYNRTKATTTNTSFGLGYVHSLSKRTSVYAEVARTKVGDDKGFNYGLRMRHNF